ncbi:hypothetical protein E4100_04730 [Soehngenia longivitae]|uniref:O-antigen ligase-related domain-containing protein n=1 Tax=Soehngenia longivitae TaxID=2562294 RepID=A0A4Z0D684_9FIRM|nr:O-antigen ligase family protein [Soehngenia longivitae]TFZ40378.1 hypothetical protein E4100_04730 [Soehngenia longivitae]
MKRTFKNQLQNSRFINFLTTDTSKNKNWNDSISLNILIYIVSLPSIIINLMYSKFHNLFDSSYFIKFFKFIGSNLHYCIGLSIIFISIIPDHIWSNLYGVVLIMLITILYYLNKGLSENPKLELKKLDYSLVIFFATLFIAGLTSVFLRESLNQLIFYIATFVFITIIILEVDSEKKLYDLIKFIVLSAVLTSIYGLYQWQIVGIAVNPSLTDLTINQNLGARVFSSFGNPNVYGEFLVLSIPFFFPLIFKANNMMQKVILTISSLPVLLMLFKTGSRSAWVAFAVCIFIFVFLWNKKYIPVLIILGLLAIPFLPSSIYNRLMTIFNPNDTSLKYRQMIMGPALVMLRDYWITGVGLGSKTVALIYQRYKSFGLTTVAHTHNLFIQLWLEAGILSILSFIMFMFRLAKNSYVKVSKFSNSKQSLIISAALASTLGILVMGLADYVWFYNRIFLMFWINISIVLSALNLKQG